MADSTYTILKNKIKDKLEAINKIQEVKDEPGLKLSGYPGAIIYPSEDESDYETTTENLRIYVFVVDLFYEIQSGGLANAIDALYDLADDVMDAFDQDQILSGISLPTRYTMIGIEPTSGAWGQVPDTKLIAKTIKLRIKISVDIS